VGRTPHPRPQGILLFSQDRPDKSFYLSKKYSQAHLEHYLEGENDPVEAKSLLTQHTEHARSKVQFFRNDLRQLQELLQRRNVFRLKEGRRSCQLPDQPQSRAKNEFSKTSYEPSHDQPHRRNDRDHSAFTALKGERLLEVYQEGKQRGEEPLGHLKRFLGVGIESTPFFGWAERHRVAEGSLRKGKPRLVVEGKPRQLKLHEQLQREVAGRHEIYLASGNPKREGTPPTTQNSKSVSSG
jgi:hypothetical protein